MNRKEFEDADRDALTWLAFGIALLVFGTGFLCGYLCGFIFI